MTVETLPKSPRSRVQMHRQFCPMFQYKLSTDAAWTDAPYFVRNVNEMRAYMIGKTSWACGYKLRRIDSFSESYCL